MIASGKMKIAGKTTAQIESLYYSERIFQMKAFLGYCNAYRRFELEFSKIAAPLNRKLKKDKPSKFIINKGELRVVNGLKNRFVSPLVLALSRANKLYTSDTVVEWMQFWFVVL